MSWITDLAGRAENILNQIDQNAATVLHQTSKSGEDMAMMTSNDSRIIVDEVSTTSNRSTPTSSLKLLSKSLTPKNLSPKYSEENLHSKLEINTNHSNLSSRRSSISSREGLQFIEEISVSPAIKQSMTNEKSIENELAAFKIALVEMKTERNELRDEIETLQEQLTEAKGETQISELNNFISTLKAEKDRVTLNLSESQQCNVNNLERIVELETNLKKCQHNLNDVNEKLIWKNKETEQIRSDLEKYRKKAQATLQMKDKIIDELKKSDSGGSKKTEFDECNNEAILEMEINNLKQELTMKNNDLHLLRDENEKTNITMQKLDENYKEKLRICEVGEIALKSNFIIEQNRCVQLEYELKILNQEISTIRQEFQKQKQSLVEQLYKKDQSISKLQKKSSEIVNASDLNSVEGKLKSLTQALFEKQAAIENVTADRNALKLQVEKVEDQLRHVISVNRPQRNQIIDVNDTDDVKLQLPLIMKENPFDTRVARRVKRAYSSLDSAGIRVGVFLRRYPLVRILVFIYIAILHLWVMFVLLSSTPT